MSNTSLIMVNRVFGKLTVLHQIPSSARDKTWQCICSCGILVQRKQRSLVGEETTSCGCSRATAQGLSDSRLYAIWQGMKARCSNPNRPKSHLYLGKGITVCEEWLDFAKFNQWANANGYTASLSIDRKNSDLNYCPENCAWVTKAVQSRNRKPNRRKGSSKFIGVNWDKSKSKWRAEISLNNKNKYLGRFDNEIDAARARDDFIKSDPSLSDFTLNFNGD